MCVAMKIYYSYVDFTNDGEVFYVGKGNNVRCLDQNRNWLHTIISEKEGFNRREITTRGLKTRYKNHLRRKETGEKTKATWANYTAEERQARVQKMREGQKKYYDNLRHLEIE